MRTIAFKQANNIKSKVKNSLPDVWITEYTYVDLQPEGSLIEEDGWQFLPEDEFNTLLAQCNNEQVYQAFKDAEHAAKQAEMDALVGQ